MDVLIDLIIYLINQATRGRERSEANRVVAARQVRLKPAPPQVVRAKTGGTALRRPARGPMTVGPVVIPKPSAVASAPAAPQVVRASAVAAAPRWARGTAPAGWKLPLILGEILSPPLALREPEF